MTMDAAKALEHVRDGVVSLDAEWRIGFVNRRAELLFGRQRDTLAGQEWWAVFDYLVGTPAESELRAAAGGSVPRRVRVFHPPRYAWHDVQVIPTGGGVLLVMDDITDVVRARQQEAVRDAVREVFDAAPAAITVLRGSEHRIEVMNQMSRQLLGGRDLEGRSIHAALPELAGQGFFELLDGVYSTGTPYHAREVPARFDPDGSGTLRDGCFDIVYQPILDVDGTVSGVLSMSVDVTDLVRERQQTSHRRRELEAVLEQLLEGVIITDASGRITFVNEVAERIHGEARLNVPPEEYQTAYHLLTPGGRPYPADELPLARAVLAGEVVRDARWKVQRADGTIVDVAGDARPVFDVDGKKIAAVLTLRTV